MTAYRHIAVDRSGQVTKGTLQTSSREEAISLLAAQGLTPISVQRQVFALNGADLGRRSNKDLLDLFDQLATLLDAGIPLAESLSVLSDRPGRLGRQATGILGSVRQGSSFAEALKTSAQSPSGQTLALVKIGEETGTLGRQLLLISANMKQARKFEQELIGGLIYPLILGLLLIATVFFLAHFILPQFETIFDQDDANLPAETRLVLALGSGVRDWGWAFPGALLSVYAAVGAIKRLAPEKAARAAHAVPLAGTIARQADLARFCRALGTLLKSNASMATALPLATSAVTNRALRSDIERHADRIRLGETAQSALGTLFPGDVRALLDVGERTGQLAELLLRGANLLEARIADRLKRLAALIGPSLTIVMGGMVAFVIAGVMMGVLGLNDLVQ